MAGAQRPRRLAGDEVAHGGVLQEGQLAVEHRDVDLRALAAGGAGEQRRIDGDRGVEPGADVADRHARARRRAAGMAGDAHDAAHALHHHVVGGLLRIRPGVAEARGRGIDQPRVLRMQRLPAIAQLLHRARAEVLDQHVGLGQQLIEHLAVGRCLQVEDDGFLAAIDRHEIGRAPLYERPVFARVVALARRLHLDHPRAHLRHQQRAVGTCEDAREVDDGDAGERA